MNLIPEDYRIYLQQLRIMQAWSLLMFAALALAAAISFGLYYMANQYQAEVTLLEKKKAISSQQRGVLQGLEKDRNQLTKKYEILQKLRDGAAAENMFITIDRALDGNNIWFKNWSFERAGSRTGDQQEAVNSAYFIVISESDRAKNRTQAAWIIQTHMVVNGEAVDYEALSSFVRRLMQQPEIGDVRILNTRQHTYDSKNVVDFKLAITVDSGYKDS